MSDIHDHNDLGPVVGQPEPPDGGMRVVAFVFVCVVAVFGLALLPAACGAGWR